MNDLYHIPLRRFNLFFFDVRLPPLPFPYNLLGGLLLCKSPPLGLDGVNVGSIGLA